MKSRDDGQRVTLDKHTLNVKNNPTRPFLLFPGAQSMLMMSSLPRTSVTLQRAANDDRFTPINDDWTLL